jgi:probable AcnD-accessory protein PrpF
MPRTSFPGELWRGGTSKGLFVRAADLPADPAARDALLLRALGSPDPYGKQVDGLGGATSSTSKVVLVSPTTRRDCAVEYLFGAVAIDRAVIDWSGNCGNLTTAVAPYAIACGLLPPPADGVANIGLWQANLGKRIVAHVPVRNGEAVEDGDFSMDGVAFPGGEIVLEFLDPGGGEGAMLPTGNVRDTLRVPGVGTIEATLVNAGNPTVFVAAADLGLAGTELQPAVNGDPALLARCEAIRAHAAVTMGLASSAEVATHERPATPKLSFVSPPAAYVASSGRPVSPGDVDLVARILSMGALHHAYTGTGAVALSVAAALPGSVVHAAVRPGSGAAVRVGHPSGVMTVGAEVRRVGAEWIVDKSVMSRSARRLMAGTVFVP